MRELCTRGPAVSVGIPMPSTFIMPIKDEKAKKNTGSSRTWSRFLLATGALSLMAPGQLHKDGRAGR